MTVHNRRGLTLSCLNSLFHQEGNGERFRLRAVVVDDGSSDGTADAVRAVYGSWVDVVPGTGNLYWAAGMARAQREALKQSFDFMLLLNDDVRLAPHALAQSLEVFSSYERRDPVVVGAMRDPKTGSTTYSAVRKTGLRPTALKTVEPTGSVLTADTFNANFVLVPHAVVSEVGIIDGRYQHGYGDLDYGFRMAAAGYPVVLCPGHLGACSFNPITGSWRDPNLSRSQRIRELFGVKGMPVRSHLLFMSSYGGALWPAWFVLSYLRALAKVVLGN